MSKTILTQEQYIANIKFLHRLEQLKEKYQKNENLVQRICKLAENRTFRTRFGQQLLLELDKEQIELSRWKSNYLDVDIGFKFQDGYFPIIKDII